MYSDVEKQSLLCIRIQKLQKLTMWMIQKFQFSIFLSKIVKIDLNFSRVRI